MTRRLYTRARIKYNVKSLFKYDTVNKTNIYIYWLIVIVMLVKNLAKTFFYFPKHISTIYHYIFTHDYIIIHF